jgi:hypothetical protein
MPQEIFDLESAILKDEITPLFEYQFGKVSIPVYPSSALSGEDSFQYVKSQLYASAVATEYEKLRKKADEIIDSVKNSEMSHEIAERYTEVLAQLTEKSTELDNWTITYIASCAKMSVESFSKMMVEELSEFNTRSGKKITLSMLVNALYAKITSANKEITVESQEEIEAKLYEKDDESEETPPKNEPITITDSIVNGSANPSTYLNGTSEAIAIAL